MLFLRAHECAELEAQASAVTSAWDRFVATGARGDADAAAQAQRRFVASLGRLPTFATVRDVHGRIVRGQELFLEAIAALVAGRQAEHLRLLGEHNALVHEANAELGALARLHRVDAVEVVPDCSFLR